jgi:hypothetical protein
MIVLITIILLTILTSSLFIAIYLGLGKNVFNCFVTNLKSNHLAILIEQFLALFIFMSISTQFVFLFKSSFGLSVESPIIFTTSIFVVLRFISVFHSEEAARSQLNSLMYIICVCISVILIVNVKNMIINKPALITIKFLPLKDIGFIAVSSFSVVMIIHLCFFVLNKIIKNRKK